MTKSLEQAYSIQTIDQQLYAIAKQFEWAKQDTFKTHILRLEAFIQCRVLLRQLVNFGVMVN